MKISEFFNKQMNQTLNEITNTYDDFIMLLTTPECWNNDVTNLDRITITICCKQQIIVEIPNAIFPLFKSTKKLNSSNIIDEFFSLRKRILPHILEKQLPKPIEEHSSENILLDDMFWYLPSQNDTAEKMKVEISAIGYTLIKINIDQPIKDIDKFFDDLKNNLNEEKAKFVKFIIDDKDTKFVIPSSC